MRAEESLSRRQTWPTERKEVGYVVFLLAFFAVVLQMCSGTEIQVLPSFVFHEADRLQTIGTTLHIYAACFRISPPTQHLVET